MSVRPSCPQPWIVGPPDLEDCNRLTGIEAKACTVLVQAWGGERCP